MERRCNDEDRCEDPIAAIEQIVDPTDQIVADLGRQLELAQSQALDGPQGLLTLMRTMNGAHQAARRQWLQPTAR